MTIKELAGKVALLIGGSRGNCALIAKQLAADGADVASVFVTNGGYNGVQQVLRMWRPDGRRRRIRPNCD
jgi:NAD(P)-dependent dehydrogenase (short-subunit alcohol dehydrogenase family)